MGHPAKYAKDRHPALPFPGLRSETWGTQIAPVLADPHLVARPEGANGVVVDDGFAVALDFDHGCGLIGSFQRQTGEAQRELVLRELDFLAGLEQARGQDLGLEAAEWR